MGIYRDAKFTWPPGTGNNTLNLNVPLQEPRPARGGTVKTKWSEDGTRVSKVRVGSGVYDIVARLRHEGSRNQLVSFLVAAVEEDEQVRYDPDDGSGVTHDCRIVEPKTFEEALSLAELWQTEGWYEIELRLRKTDGTDWSDLLSNIPQS